MRLGKSYVPCLRWKMGEYQALLQLSSHARELIMPLIEIPEVGFDFETHENSKSIDEHLSKLGKRLKEKWGRSECFIDMRHIENSERMANGQIPSDFVFDDLRTNGIDAIPVIGINENFQIQSSVFRTAKLDGKGFCLRVTLEEVVESDFADKVKKMHQRSKLSVEQFDLILDLVSPNFEPLDGFAGLLMTIIRDIPYLNKWRSFVIVGTSFPSSLSGVKSGLSILPRNEWQLYKILVDRLEESNIRIPTFGDYVINNPEVLTLDPRLMRPKANIRYTIDDSWLIARGENVKDYGLGQHQGLCSLVINSSKFSGSSFSNGDKYISDCAKGIASTGNLTTWRRVGTNHHLEMVAREAATFAAS
jgi:hypothetical protein